MKRILVTGGDGVFGRVIVKILLEQGQIVRVMSRKAAPENLQETLEWAQADVITGQGVEAALSDVHTIVNCMSSPGERTYETDIVGTRNFLMKAKEMKIQYLVHISIIGVDRIMYPYYQYKLGSELVVAECGIPYLMSRIAQFYYLVDYWLSPLRKVEADELAIPVDVQFQAISHDDAAAYLTPYIIDDTDTGRLPDFGGAEIMRLEALAAAWLKAQGIHKTIKPATDVDNDLPAFNAFGDGFVKGYNTNPDKRVHGLSWIEYLRQRYGER